MRISDWSSDVCSSDLIRITSGQASLTGIALKVGQENGNGGYVLNHDYTIEETGDPTGISSVSSNKFSSEALESSFANTLVKLDPVKYGADYVTISRSGDNVKISSARLGLSGNQNSVLDGALWVQGPNKVVQAPFQS